MREAVFCPTQSFYIFFSLCPLDFLSFHLSSHTCLNFDILNPSFLPLLCPSIKNTPAFPFLFSLHIYSLCSDLLLHLHIAFSFAISIPYHLYPLLTSVSLLSLQSLWLLDCVLLNHCLFLLSFHFPSSSLSFFHSLISLHRAFLHSHFYDQPFTCMPLCSYPLPLLHLLYYRYSFTLPWSSLSQLILYYSCSSALVNPLLSSSLLL